MKLSTDRVLIIGASDKPDRYAHKAMVELLRYEHEVILVHPRLKQIEGRPVHADLSTVEGPIDTVTMYVNPSISTGMADALVALKPKRVIFNPGTENPELAQKLSDAGISTEDACTLVLLATGAY